MEIQWLDLDELTPYEKNPRKNDASVDRVAASIKEFGFQQPIVLDKDHVIVAGHTRYSAAKKLGWDKVPCIIADGLTDEQAKAYRLADNKVGESSEWDFDLLGEELDGIFDIDMAEFGFDLEPPVEINEHNDETTSFNYVEQYGVIVMCENESEQERVYNELTEKGYSCKVVAV